MKILGFSIDGRPDIQVTIKLDANGEYRVPSPDGREEGAYYTDDLHDAVDTAFDMYKRMVNYHDAVVKIRRISGYHNG